MEQIRWLRVGGLVMGVMAVFLITVIASGMLDPKPTGELVQTWENRGVTAVAHEQAITWLSDQLPPGNFSLRATVVHQNGEPDSSAGIVLETDCANIIIALSPLGYATIQQSVRARQVEDTLSCQASSNPPVSPLPGTDFPWQPWPHVHTGTQSNEIWIDVEDGQMRIRINRELLWAGDMPFAPERVGTYGESWGSDAASATAVYTFSQIQLFTESN